MHALPYLLKESEDRAGNVEEPATTTVTADPQQQARTLSLSNMTDGDGDGGDSGSPTSNSKQRTDPPDGGDDDDDGNNIQQQPRTPTQAELEAAAVLKAKAAADANWTPPASLLNAPSAEALLQALDAGGPTDLATYEAKESIYVGRSVPVAAGTQLDVPIQVLAPGSVVEYAMELAAYDIGFGILAEREEGITVVKDMSTVDAASSPVTQKFLVGTVPCLIQLQFDNTASWFREKQVSYRITITPPSRDSLLHSRRRRAQACVQALQKDLQQATNRLQAASQQKTVLQEHVAKLMAELQEQKKSWQVAEQEEKWLQGRQKLRQEQLKLLQNVLQNGWEDEKEAKNSKQANGE